MRSQLTTILIVNWNSATFLKELLNSIGREEVSETIVVDNASTDGSLDVLKNHPDVTTIINSSNVGYGAAANQGLEISKTPYVLLLNADVTILPGSIAIMEDYMNHHQTVALAAPQLIFPDGQLQPSIRSFPTAGSMALYLSYLDRVWPSSYRKKAAEHQEIQEVDQPMGAAMMIRKSALEEIGFFDPQFFLYMEEVDLCYRIKQKGYKIVYLPRAQMIHHAGGSSQQDWERSQRNFFDSLFLYFRKHAPEEERKLRRMLPRALFFRAIISLIRGRFSQSRFYFREASARTAS